MPKPNGVRWGRVREIRHVKRVTLNNGQPSAAFKALPRRLKHLAAWRRAHMAGGHQPVARFGHKAGYRPSSNLPVSGKVAFLRKKGI